MSEEHNKEKTSVPKGILLTVAVFVLLAILIAGVLAIHGAVWVFALGLTIWTAFGSSVQLYGVVKVWLSGFVGLGFGWLFANWQSFGVAAIVIVAVFVVLVVFFIIIDRFTIICNSYTALFLTVSTATGLVLDPREIVVSLLFGFVTLGIIPATIAYFVGRKQKKEAKAGVADGGAKEMEK